MKSFVEAMNEKLDALSCHIIKYKMAVSKYSLAQPSTPISLFLSNCNIARAFQCDSEVADVKEKCSQLIELDLEANHLKQWPEIFKIIDKLPKLTVLNISNNQLGAIDPIGVLPMHEKLHTIILNRTNICWSDVGHLIKILPQLKELHLSANNYTCVTIDTMCDGQGMTIVPSYDNLEKLFVDKNLLTDWEDVNRIGRIFPKLRSLSVSGCPIVAVKCSTNLSDAFPELEYLNLNDTKLRTWDDIYQLAKLVKLEKLCIRRLPLFDAYTEHQHRAWKLLVGILPALQTLNNSVIFKEDRMDANALIEIEFQRIRS